MRTLGQIKLQMYCTSRLAPPLCCRKSAAACAATPKGASAPRLHSAKPNTRQCISASSKRQLLLTAPKAHTRARHRHSSNGSRPERNQTHSSVPSAALSFTGGVSPAPLAAAAAAVASAAIAAATAMGSSSAAASSSASTISAAMAAAADADGRGLTASKGSSSGTRAGVEAPAADADGRGLTASNGSLSTTVPCTEMPVVDPDDRGLTASKGSSPVTRPCSWENKGTFAVENKGSVGSLPSSNGFEFRLSNEGLGIASPSGMNKDGTATVPPGGVPGGVGGVTPDGGGVPGGVGGAAPIRPGPGGVGGSNRSESAS